METCPRCGATFLAYPTDDEGNAAPGEVIPEIKRTQQADGRYTIWVYEPGGDPDSGGLVHVCDYGT